MIKRKYELMAGSEIHIFGKTLYRIKALTAFRNITPGQAGGYLESENNLSHEGLAWVAGNAMVFGDARVSENAQVIDFSLVCDSAKIFGDAEVNSRALIAGNAELYGNARVLGFAMVCENATIHDDATVLGNATVSGNVNVCGKARVCGNACLSDHVLISGSPYLSDNVRICGDVQVFGSTKLSSDVTLCSKKDMITFVGVGYDSDTLTVYRSGATLAVYGEGFRLRDVMGEDSREGSDSATFSGTEEAYLKLIERAYKCEDDLNYTIDLQKAEKYETLIKLARLWILDEPLDEDSKKVLQKYPQYDSFWKK